MIVFLFRVDISHQSEHRYLNTSTLKTLPALFLIVLLSFSPDQKALGAEGRDCLPLKVSQSPTQKSETIVCKDPRPQMCTMDYRPVCGTKSDGTQETYSNGCGACSDPEVVEYLAGECRDRP